MATPLAPESLARHAILACHVVAARAGARGVARVDEHQLHAGGQGLVGEQRAQLGKGPAAVPGSVLPANRCPLADASKLFEGQSARGAFGSLHELVGDLVILDLTKAGLLAREIRESASRTARATGLQLLAQAVVLLPHSLDVRPRIDAAIAVGGQVHDTQIHAKETTACRHGVVVEGDRDRQVDLALAHAQVSLAESLSLREQRSLGASDEEGNPHPLAVPSQAHLGLLGKERVGVSVEGEGGVRTEARALLGLGGEGGRDGAEHTDGVLGGQSEARTQLSVKELVEGEGRASRGRPGLLGEPGAGLVESCEQGHEVGSLSRFETKLDGHGDDHEVEEIRTRVGGRESADPSGERECQSWEGGSSPPSKGGGSAAFRSEGNLR